jgi:BlaI family transcriptional regulator, penicillinase repressor
MTAVRLGKVQMKIMQVLWEKGRASAREITDALNVEQAIAHSTVQTLLRKLEAKNAVRHEVDDRTFVFIPVVNEDRAKWSAVSDLMERTFGGSAAELVAYLFQQERISGEELERIRKQVREPKRKRG